MTYWLIALHRHVKIDRSIFANCFGGKPAEEGQRDVGPIISSLHCWVYFKIYLAYLLRCVNPAALPLLRSYSTRPPRRVAIAERTTAVNELNRQVSTSPVISAWWWLMPYDVTISGARIRTYDLWVRKRVCYPLHRSAPQTQVTVKQFGYTNVKRQNERECSLQHNTSVG